MHRSDVLRTLDARVHARSILQHPFYIAWERGALTRAQLAIYARTYYPHVHAFPRYLEATIERTDDAASRVELQRNLADELSRPKAHHELWLDFADALGLDRHRVATAPPTPFARATVETFERLDEPRSRERVGRALRLRIAATRGVASEDGRLA